VGGRGKIEGGGEDEIRKGKKKTKKKKNLMWNATSGCMDLVMGSWV